MSQTLLIRTAARWKISRELAIVVIARDARCIYCQVEFEAPFIVRRTCPSWEHIVNDVSLVGPENIALCCVSCNASKGAQTLKLWLTSTYCRSRHISIASIAEIASKTLEFSK